VGVVPGTTNYTAVIRVTDTSNQVATSTVYFDTFSPTNFTWEAEDWDYGSGQFFDNPAIDQYFSLSGALGVDYWVDLGNLATGVKFTYRPGDYIGTEVCSDTPLPKYAAAAVTNSAVLNYDVGWWVAGQWMNFTRTYPAGNYWVYGRLAAGGAYQAQLSLVTPTATNLLGNFTGQGRGWTLYDYAPLLDVNGQRATINIAGLNTLRVTSLGGDNANFFMLVPAIAAPSPVQLTASLHGNGVRLSFPTLSGYNYKDYFKNDLSDTGWTLLTMVAGDGTVKSVDDTAPGGRRFYRLVIQ